MPQPEVEQNSTRVVSTAKLQMEQLAVALAPLIGKHVEIVDERRQITTGVLKQILNSPDSLWLKLDATNKATEDRMGDREALEHWINPSYVRGEEILRNTKEINTIRELKENKVLDK